MNDQLFRKKSVDKVSSPEQLNEYIRVANPGVWMVLAAIVILLAGVVVWGFIGHLDTTLSAEEREIGGLGIFMVKKTMDEIAYEYKDGQNILAIKKNLQ